MKTIELAHYVFHHDPIVRQRRKTISLNFFRYAIFAWAVFVLLVGIILSPILLFALAARAVGNVIASFYPPE